MFQLLLNFIIAIKKIIQNYFFSHDFILVTTNLNVTLSVSLWSENKLLCFFYNYVLYIVAHPVLATIEVYIFLVLLMLFIFNVITWSVLLFLSRFRPKRYKLRRVLATGLILFFFSLLIAIILGFLFLLFFYIDVDTTNIIEALEKSIEAKELKTLSDLNDFLDKWEFKNESNIIRDSFHFYDLSLVLGVDAKIWVPVQYKGIVLSKKIISFYLSIT